MMYFKQEQKKKKSTRKPNSRRNSMSSLTSHRNPHIQGSNVTPRTETRSIIPKGTISSTLDSYKRPLPSMNFRSLRARNAWVVLKRQYISCAVSFAAQITERFHDTECNHAFNRIVKHLEQTAQIQMSFPKLYVNSVGLPVYTDASQNNKEHKRSQLG